MGKLTLGHGSGGRLTQELAGRLVAPFAEMGPPEYEDCALLSAPGIPETLATSIDGFTVTPLFFPGGSLGTLAVCGSANDLAVRAARARWLCLSLVAEEGEEEETLSRLMEQAAAICREQGIRLVAGDTKVVPRGAIDRVMMSTCAIGTLERPGHPLSSASLRPGDAILVTGPLGRHEATLAAVRYELEAEGLESDCAPLWPTLSPLLDLAGLRCMRDCTRGGLGTTLCEWAEAAGTGIEFDEEGLPLDEPTLSVADILGLDPLYLACEGTAVVAVEGPQAEEALERLSRAPGGSGARRIGRVTETHRGQVCQRTRIGGLRLVDMLQGEQLPRIC
jgi:hydrogenase expression/formation protein HypE